MRSIDRRAAFAFAAISLVAIAGCSKSDPAPSGCTRAPTPTTGPGDTLNYFPAAVGWTWQYQRQPSGMTATTTVTGTAPVGSETAFVFMSYADTSTTEMVVKRPSGAYVVSEVGAEPPLDQVYPSLILPFPVEPRPAVEQVRCSNLDVGDLDGDGKSDRADLSATLQVYSVTETAQVPVGSFTDVAHAQTVAHVTVRATRAGSVSVDATQDDWYARDVGRVLSHVWMGNATVTVEDETFALQSWTAPGTAVLTPSFEPLVAEPAAPEPSRTPLEAAALRLARRAVGAPR